MARKSNHTVALANDDYNYLKKEAREIKNGHRVTISRIAMNWGVSETQLKDYRGYWKKRNKQLKNKLK